MMQTVHPYCCIDHRVCLIHDCNLWYHKVQPQQYVASYGWLHAIADRKKYPLEDSIIYNCVTKYIIVHSLSAVMLLGNSRLMVIGVSLGIKCFYSGSWLTRNASKSTDTKHKRKVPVHPPQQVKQTWWCDMEGDFALGFLLVLWC